MRGRGAVALACVLASVPATSANPLHQGLTKLPEPERNTRLTAMLTREECRLVSSFFQGLDRAGAAHWNVVCADQQAYALRIMNDAAGSTGVLECGLVERLGGAACFTRLSTAE
jgi:hypothetical protein